MSTVKQEVEAALLNSEEDPERAVDAAFEGMARFVQLDEVRMSRDEFGARAMKAWNRMAEVPTSLSLRRR